MMIIMVMVAVRVVKIPMCIVDSNKL